MFKLHQLHELGQSTWLNYMRREFICSGEFASTIRAGIQGITANAAVFAGAIANATDYDEDIHRQLIAGTPHHRIHDMLMTDDVQRAADLLHPVYERTAGRDGFASLELDPALSANAVDTVATARRLLARIDRVNAMVEVPATPQGLEAVRTLVADGVCINATHLFRVEDYERVAQAYISGLEVYFDTHSVWRLAPAAVASFSVGAIDQAVDADLTAAGRPELRGKAGLALAGLLYARYLQIFDGPRWQRLASRGAQPLRPMWTRTRPHTELYAPTFYVDALVGPETVVTFDLKMLAQFEQQGDVVQMLPADIDAALLDLQAVVDAGVDVDAIVDQLQARYLQLSVEDYNVLTSEVRRKLYDVALAR